MSNEYCRDTTERPLRRGLMKCNTVPLTQVAPVEVYSDIAVSNSENENIAPSVATHTTQLCVIGGVSERSRCLESTRLVDDATNGRANSEGPDINHETETEKNACDLETGVHKAKTPYIKDDIAGYAEGASRIGDPESERSAETSSMEKPVDQSD